MEILNNSIECSLRLVVLINELTTGIDFQRIIYYDYALLHSGDFDSSQESLYPSSPFRKEELYVKNRLIKDALAILCQKQLVDVEYKETGVLYKKTNLSQLFLNYLSTDYFLSLKEKAKWINVYFNSYNDQQLKEYFDKTIGEWKSEFSTYGLTRTELVVQNNE